MEKINVNNNSSKIGTIMEQEGFKKCIVCEKVFYTKRTHIITCSRKKCLTTYRRIYARIYYRIIKKYEPGIKKQKCEAIPKRVCYKCGKKCYGKLCKKCYVEKKGMPLTKVYNQRKNKKIISC